MSNLFSRFVLIIDYQYRHNPIRQNVQLKRNIAQERLLRLSAFVLAVHQVQVAKDTVEDERDSQRHVAAELMNRLFGKGEDHVCDKGRRGHHSDHLIEQIGSVFLEYHPVNIRLLFEKDNLMPPFGESQKKSQQHGADKDPVGYRNMDRQRPRDYPQNESEADYEYIEDNHMFQEKCIGGLKENISENSSPEPGIEQEGNNDCDDAKTGGQKPAGSQGDQSGRKRTAFLYRMGAVFLHIDDVIENVDSAGYQAEKNERLDRLRDIRKIPRVTGENKRRKDERILGPLTDSQGFQYVAYGHQSILSLAKVSKNDIRQD
jgi:hypothetical protein